MERPDEIAALVLQAMKSENDRLDEYFTDDEIIALFAAGLEAIQVTLRDTLRPA